MTSRRPLLLLLIVALASVANAQSSQWTHSVFVNMGFDGGVPDAPVILAADGNFYGTASAGGTNNDGVVFKVTPSGTISTLYSFCQKSSCADGQFPYTGLVQGSDGNFYGTTTDGGVNGGGIAFKLTPAGVFTTLYAFCAKAKCADGEIPSQLVQGSDGNFYGTTLNGGTNTYGNSSQGGTVFQLTPAGKLTTLYSFCSQKSCADGTLAGGLIQGSDGNFYGLAESGGSGGYGTAYKISSGGSFSIVLSFCGGGGKSCPNGSAPNGTLVEASDGSFYGVTQLGGVNTATGAGGGTAFNMTSGGGLTTLYSFCSLTNCTDGYAPGTGLYLATDGNYYGTTLYGNSFNNNAVVFEISGSKVTPIYTFCSQSACTDGEFPSASLIQGADGDLYSVTQSGGAYSDGTIYKLASTTPLPGPVQLTLSGSSIALGSSVTLDWSVAKAYSLTLQQCYAFVQNSATGACSWSGKNPGSSGGANGSLKITPTAAGTYTYALTCGGSESGFATLTVTGSSKAASTTALTASPASPTVGQSVTLKATVTGSGATPTGSVNFSADGASLATINLNSSGVASLTASTNGIAPATYPVVATYSGNSSYNSSASPATGVSLGKAPTSTALTASPTSVTPPASVTLTATVKRSASGANGTPTGTVTFYADSSTALATITLNSGGVATVTAPSSGYPAATYAITARYNGDSADGGSTSSAVNVTVK
jgi:uncharacterized repeat protein (TIGR03803 family)